MKKSLFAFIFAELTQTGKTKQTRENQVPAVFGAKVMTISELTKRVKNIRVKSAWDKGVKYYAEWMCANLEEWDEFSENTGIAPNRSELKSVLLNGADSWKSASWGGSFLICDGEIAATLCNRSELKKTKNGERKPNSREEWLDVQARALYQAYRMITNVMY